jgi:hypothetical protein
MNNFLLQFLPLAKPVLPYVRKVQSKLSLDPLTFPNGELDPDKRIVPENKEF